MKDAHLTLRLPAGLARLLARAAAARGVPKSQVARDAVARYLAAGTTDTPPPGLAARELARRWVTLPHLQPDEAAGLAEAIEAARTALPSPTPAWE
jgi:predicted transcriptional regulator